MNNYLELEINDSKLQILGSGQISWNLENNIVSYL